MAVNGKFYRWELMQDDDGDWIVVDKYSIEENIYDHAFDWESGLICRDDLSLANPMLDVNEHWSLAIDVARRRMGFEGTPFTHIDIDEMTKLLELAKTYKHEGI